MFYDVGESLRLGILGMVSENYFRSSCFLSMNFLWRYSKIIRFMMSYLLPVPDMLVLTLFIDSFLMLKREIWLGSFERVGEIPFFLSVERLCFIVGEHS
jgi:hypothetical protein